MGVDKGIPSLKLMINLSKLICKEHNTQTRAQVAAAELRAV